MSKIKTSLICFKKGDAEDLPFEDQFFDSVASRNLLWTLPDPERALKEWRRVMKPGATLILSDGFWLNITRMRTFFFHCLCQTIKISCCLDSNTNINDEKSRLSKRQFTNDYYTSGSYPLWSN